MLGQVSHKTNGRFSERLSFHWNSLRTCHHWLISHKHDLQKRLSVSWVLLNCKLKKKNLHPEYPTAPHPQIHWLPSPSIFWWSVTLRKTHTSSAPISHSLHSWGKHHTHRIPHHRHTGEHVCARTPQAQAKSEDLYSDSKENKLLHLCMTNERKGHAMSN